MRTIGRVAVTCALLTIAPCLVYGSGVIRYETAADLSRLFSTSDLIVVGEIQAVEIECRGSRGADADITLKPVEVWYGACDSEITIRAVLVNPDPEMSCGGRYDRSKPSRLEPGDKYLFLCMTRFDQKAQNFDEGYIVGIGGILSYDENQGDIWYSSDGEMFLMDLKNVANTAKNGLLATEPLGLYEASDLVVVAKGVDVQDDDPNRAYLGEFSLVADAPTASVVEVLKGAYSGKTIRFNPDLFSQAPRRSIVKATDTVVLFLKELNGEYGLVEGTRGLAVLENGRILSTSRKPTGAFLNADRNVVADTNRIH